MWSTVLFHYTDAVIGFEQTEVTVIEGEDAFLMTFFRNNDTIMEVSLRCSRKSVKEMQQVWHCWP